MGQAKEIELRPISRREGDAAVRRWHYSGKVVNNAQLHIGVYLHGRIEGVMQFGPSLDKRKLIGLVEGTRWNEFLELVRMAFSETLPRNSESRALGVAMRLLKQHAPHVKWIVSFADATRCGDGTIYRAAGFVLTGIKENSRILRMPDGRIEHRLTFMDGSNGGGIVKRRYGFIEGEGDSRFVRRVGATALAGHQLRYLYFLDPSCRERLTVAPLPYAEIGRRRAGMYRGQPCVRGAESGAVALQATGGGATPTRTLAPRE